MSPPRGEPRVRIWSVGHSTLGFPDFIGLLRAHDVERIADVRTTPKSRRHPHFAIDALAVELPLHGVDYRHVARLGGRRRTSAGSPNGGWRNASFRGYADHAASEEFAQALRELRELAANARTAMMCSEALWWRCHRRLIADRLVAHGDDVVHIGSDGRASPHALAPFAVVRADGTIVYPQAAGDEPAAASQ